MESRLVGKGKTFTIIDGVRAKQEPKASDGISSLAVFLVLQKSHVRKGREGRAESLSHLLRWSFQKRYTLVAQPLRMNMLPRNFCATYRFWKRNRTVSTPMQVWQERCSALSSLPPPPCLHDNNQNKKKDAQLDVFLTKIYLCVYWLTFIKQLAQNGLQNTAVTVVVYIHQAVQT